MPNAPRLVLSELQALKAAITPHAHASFGGVGEHDDLVLAVSWAVSRAIASLKVSRVQAWAASLRTSSKRESFMSFCPQYVSPSLPAIQRLAFRFDDRSGR